MSNVVAIIVSSVITGAVTGAAGVFVGRLHRRPDGKCRRHKVQAVYKGFRIGAVEPNWYCQHGGGHYVDRLGREYEPTTEKAAAVGLLAVGIAILSLLKKS